MGSCPKAQSHKLNCSGYFRCPVRQPHQILVLETFARSGPTRRMQLTASSRLRKEGVTWALSLICLDASTG